MRKNAIVLSILIIGFIGGIGFVTYKELSKTSAKKTNPSAVAGVQNSAPSKQVSNSAKNQASGVDSTSGLSVSGLNSQSQSLNSQKNGVLNPEDFDAYQQQYENSDQLLAQDLELGTGTEVKPGDEISVYYVGWLTDGSVFDMTRKDEATGNLKPFTFTVGSGQVISGWDVGTQGMKVGGTRRLVLPPTAGYGATGNSSIPPNAVLVFDIELVSIKQ